jgi:hypothetical protein
MNKTNGKSESQAPSSKTNNVFSKLTGKTQLMLASDQNKKSERNSVFAHAVNIHRSSAIMVSQMRLTK